MCYEMIEEQLLSLCSEISIDFDEEEMEIDVRVEDFCGFDDEWREIMRDVDDEEMIDWLEEYCDFSEGDFYRYYHFGEIVVCVGWASFDI